MTGFGNKLGLFGALKSDSTHHFFRNACTKSGSLRFSQFSGCWLILSVYIIIMLYYRALLIDVVRFVVRVVVVCYKVDHYYCWRFFIWAVVVDNCWIIFGTHSSGSCLWMFISFYYLFLTDFVCLYNYEFGLSLCKIVRSSVILLLPLFTYHRNINV
jgi:hypothetical protein